MTSKLEKQFFDTFGIEPITTYSCYEYYTYERNVDIWGEHCEKYVKDGGKCDDCNYKKFIRDYPQITDSILLELICILSRWHLDEREPYEIISINIKQLKNQILSNSLYIAKYAKAKHQVRTLFGENND